jgi:hypothetical protein
MSNIVLFVERTSCAISTFTEIGAFEDRSVRVEVVLNVPAIGELEVSMYAS